MNKKFLITLIVLFTFSSVISAQTIYQAHSQLELMTDVKSVQPGVPFWVGLHMQMDPEWHVYWKNPGDSGFGAVIKWKLPKDFSVGEIQWPYPKRINIGPLTSFGYEEEVILWTKIVPPKDFQAPNVSISAEVDWLTCKIECVPGKAKLVLLLPVSSQAEINEEGKEALENSRRLWPMDPKGSPWGFRAEDAGENFVIELWPSSSKMVAENVIFYPDSDKLIEHAEPQELKSSRGVYTLTLKKSHLITKPPGELSGILVQDEGWDEEGKYRAIPITLPLEKVLPFNFPMDKPQDTFLMCIFAFLGGIILNFMPCVLPVLSLKIIGLVKSARDHRQITMSGLLFTAGVVISFWILAGLLIALQSAGHQLGWGFQFQSPVFVAAMAAILFILGHNLLGVFEIGTSLTGIGQSAPSTGYLGSFLSGVLATIVATPCTAPFMGTAISFALTQPPADAFLIFTFLALGMASLYLLLCLFPGALRFVPKPGPWMIVLKGIFGFVLFACVIWLVWILDLQKGINAVIVLAVGLLFITIGLWFLGLIQQGKGGPKSVLFVWIFLVGGLLVAILGPVIASPGGTKQSQNGLLRPPPRRGPPLDKSIAWQEFSPELLTQLRAEKKPVFIDFTAAWCLSCQVNDRLVFQNKKVVAEFQNLGIIALKADWTNHSEVITKALASYGKNSIPVYVLYGKESHDPVLLPELVTPELVIGALHEHITN